MEIEGTKSFHNFNVTPNLCRNAILREDWLHQHKAHIGFKSAVLEINGVRTPLGGTPVESVVVETGEDVKLPLRTAVSNRGRLMTGMVLKRMKWLYARQWREQPKWYLLC